MQLIKPPQKFVILDRDGVINYDSAEYIKSPEEWIPVSGSIEAIAALSQAGWRIAVVTNQSGIARGLYTEHILQQIHKKMLQMVEVLGGKIDAVLYCPHHPNEYCECRKPKPGLLLRLAEQFQLNLQNIPFVGDKQSDVEVAQAVGCQPVLVKTGIPDNFPVNLSVPVYNNLAEVIEDLLKLKF